MVTWHKGSTYPDVQSLAQAYQDKKKENFRTTLLYIAAAIILCSALFYASQEWLVILGGIAAIVIIFFWMSLRWNSYNKMSRIVESKDFTWTAGKVQNKWKRQMFDMNTKSPYQVGLCDEWIACDMTTHNQAEIGKSIVLVKSDDYAVGIMIPEGGAHKRVRRVARAAS